MKVAREWRVMSDALILYRNGTDGLPWKLWLFSGQFSLWSRKFKIFETSDSASHKTVVLRLDLFRKVMEVYLENNTEHMKSIKSVGKMQLVKAGVL
jgi:hypothetical protein